MDKFQTEVHEVINHLMPLPHIPIDIRRLILELSGLLHVGKRTIGWLSYFPRVQSAANLSFH